MNNQLASKPSDLRSIITSDKMKQQFAAALPHHLSPDRFCRIALTALTRTPKLADCTQESLMRCLLELSAYGIEPDGRRAHLIPYGNQCTLILDWKGLAELAMRSGIISKLHADIVCENDVFTYNLGEIVEHKIDWRAPRGTMYAAYAMAVTKDGPVFVAVLTKDEIDGIRKRSRAGNNGPWVTDFNEMAKKTAFRRLAKWLPLSAEFRDAVDKDDDLPTEKDVTPKVARAVPLDPFASALPQPQATEEAPPVVEAEYQQPVTEEPATQEVPEMEENPLLLDLLDGIAEANSIDGLTRCKEGRSEIESEAQRAIVTRALQQKAKELGLTWSSKTSTFIPV